MHKKPQIQNNIDTFFKNLEDKQLLSDVCKENILSEMNTLLVTRNYQNISNIISMCNDSNIIISSDIYRIANILSFTQKELAYSSSTCFLSDINNLESLINKYEMCLFALQRINLNLEQSHVNVAVEYLTSVAPSPYAIWGIVTHEYLEDFNVLLNDILNIMSPFWSDDYIYIFLRLLSDYFPTNNNFLHISSFLIDHGIYQNALGYLKRIIDPNNMIKQLISQLEELVDEQ